MLYIQIPRSSEWQKGLSAKIVKEPKKKRITYRNKRYKISSLMTEQEQKVINMAKNTGKWELMQAEK